MYGDKNSQPITYQMSIPLVVSNSYEGNGSLHGGNTLLKPKRIRNHGDKIFTNCVCVFSSHLFWTSSSLDVPAGVTQEEGHTGFLIYLPSAVRALIFLARRIRHSFPSSTVFKPKRIRNHDKTLVGLCA